MTSKWEGSSYDREQTSSRIPRRSADDRAACETTHRAFGTVSTVIRVNPDGISCSRLRDKGSRGLTAIPFCSRPHPPTTRGCFHRKLEIGEEKARRDDGPDGGSWRLRLHNHPPWSRRLLVLGGGFNLVGLPGDLASVVRCRSTPSTSLVLARPEFRIPCVNTHPFVAPDRRLSESSALREIISAENGALWNIQLSKHFNYLMHHIFILPHVGDEPLKICVI